MAALLLLVLGQGGQAEQSAARQWNEECLAAIRLDFPAPTVHARNLYHCSAAMYDAWAAYDQGSVGVFHNEAALAGDLAAARREAVSFAAYRVLRARYALAVDPATTLAALDARLESLGYQQGETTVLGPSPAAVGNRCAAAVLEATILDGANEQQAYAGNSGYYPVNRPLILQNSGTGTLAQPNRWQPLAFDVAFTQNGQVAAKVQTFVGSHWGHVASFALSGDHLDGVYSDFDPGAPPYFSAEGDAEFRANNIEVIRFSAGLDPLMSAPIDISPGAMGNSALGTNDGTGHPINPSTGKIYQVNEVNHADFGRVLAEFWADGPESETPPGHWNVLANEVGDHPAFEKKLGGTGPVLDDLEWDVKLYLPLNAAVHDSAVAAWGIKAHYDYVRPITSIRYMGSKGQSSDPGGLFYHPDGLPLVPDLIEVVTPWTAAPGERHEGLSVGKVAVFAWQGEKVGGVGWIHAIDWLPYQRSTFVTPAFAGYISGHSTFSRAAAEVLTGFTGSAFFPGGMGTHTVEAGELEFEDGPQTAVELQWATYQDAADQAGISRLYGGIHVAVDDGPGRVIGAKVGRAALAKAMRYIDGSVLDGFHCTAKAVAGECRISWPCLPGYLYKIQSSTSLAEDDFEDVTEMVSYDSNTASFVDGDDPQGTRFYRVVREGPVSE